MATVYLYKFNNYYNRQVKKYDTLAEYGSYYYMETGTNVNFNPNDGVNTMHVFGRQSNPYEGECDYLIYCKDNVNITSRWFIIEQTRKLVGQYDLTLHRDVIVDNYNEVISSPCFIEKATLRDDDILIYNKESIAVNQIKTSETLLKDTTDCAWICGYIPRDYGKLIEKVGSVEKETAEENLERRTLTFSAANAADIEVDDLEDWQYYQYIGENVCKLGSRKLEFRARRDVRSDKQRFYLADYYVYPSGLWHFKRLPGLPADTSGWTTYWLESFALDTGDTLDRLKNDLDNNYVAANLWNNVSPYLTGVTYSDSVYNTLKGMQGKVIKAGNSYYKVDIALSTALHVNEVTADKTGAPLYTNWKNLITAVGGTVTNPAFKGFIKSAGANLVMTLQPLPQGEYKIVMPGVTERYHLKDAPYDMFCIPYAVEKASVKVKSTGTSAFAELAISSSQAMSIAQGIAEAVGKDNIYDLQLLPYCPMSGFDLTHAVDTSTIDIKATDTKRYTMVTNPNGDTKRAVILWSLSSQGSLNIEKPITVVNKKIENQTDRYRICSPNYNGTFEFNAAYNDGVDRFNVDYTYLPYNPYIHVNPNFKILYGNDFNDARGMVVQGDFSVAYLSDAWANYQVQNKNYLNIFNRGLENMETNNSIGNIQRHVGAITGTVQGAVMGGMAGGPWGAVAGGVASLAGGAADIYLAQQLHNKTIDYTKDNFGYNLQNIQALPDSIARTTAYTANNKVFPILEYYTCKDEEKMIFANKIAWNGMTVMAIGNIGSYLNNSWTYGGITDKGYIKGQLIRLEGISDDYHMLKAISEEINKGAYFK